MTGTDFGSGNDNSNCDFVDGVGPYVVFEYLHKQSLVQNSQSNTQVRSNRISGSLYPCSHTPGMVLVTMAVFLNEYEEEHDTEEQCVVVRWRI